jgi:ATP-dependent protease Clp ATPase subunit
MESIVRVNRPIGFGAEGPRDEEETSERLWEVSPGDLVQFGMIPELVELMYDMPRSRRPCVVEVTEEVVELRAAPVVTYPRGRDDTPPGGGIPRRTRKARPLP